VEAGLDRDQVAVEAKYRGRDWVPVVWVVHLLLAQKDIVFVRIVDIK
jgi:hypothetical protein